MKNLHDFKVLVLAAGYGTRLKPLTNIWPKCLMPIGKKPLLEYWLYKIKKAGFKNVYINTHYKKNIVKKFLNQSIFQGWVSEL